MKSDRQILKPFHGLEALTIQEASYRTGIPEKTLRRWMLKYGLGRRLEGYERPWTLNKVALAMHLAGNREALGAYHRGERKAEIVARYYRSEGIADLLRGPLFVNERVRWLLEMATFPKFSLQIPGQHQLSSYQAREQR